MNNLCSVDFFGTSELTIFFGFLSLFLMVAIAVVIYVGVRFNIDGLEKLVFWMSAAMLATMAFTYSTDAEYQKENEIEYAKFLTFALTMEDTERIYLSNFVYEDESIHTSSEDRLNHIVESKTVFHESSLVKGRATIYGTTNFAIEGNFIVTPVFGYEGLPYLEYVDIKAGNPYGLPNGFYNKVIYVPYR